MKVNLKNVLEKDVPIKDRILSISNNVNKLTMPADGDLIEVDVGKLDSFEITLSRNGRESWPETLWILLEDKQLKWPVDPEPNRVRVGPLHKPIDLTGLEGADQLTLTMQVGFRHNEDGEENTTVTVGDDPPGGNG